MAVKAIYQIKASIKGIHPPIWRRLLVRPESTLHDLHRALQAAFGWFDYHVHEFVVGDDRYGDPGADTQDALDPVHDERANTLAGVLKEEGGELLYLYASAGHWRHEVVLEKRLPEEPGERYPACIGGKRHGPPEGCGGVRGYSEFLEAIDDPEHPEHAEMLEWVGGRFDPEAFDLATVNAALEAL